MKITFIFLTSLILFFHASKKDEVVFVNNAKQYLYRDTVEIRCSPSKNIFLVLNDTIIIPQERNNDLTYSVFKFTADQMGENSFNIKDDKGVPYYNGSFNVFKPSPIIHRLDPLIMNRPVKLDVMVPTVPVSEIEVVVDGKNELKKVGALYSLTPKSQEVILTVKTKRGVELSRVEYLVKPER